MRKITMQEVERHNTPDDCWVVINGNVYDLSTFHQEHPGGSQVITENAGKDVSSLFNSLHPADIIQMPAGHLARRTGVIQYLIRIPVRVIISPTINNPATKITTGSPNPATASRGDNTPRKLRMLVGTGPVPPAATVLELSSRFANHKTRIRPK